ncbi:hypothetical protein ColKHC_01510 [Colletotrichum higginsianum]|nr:hypothetical protein ColKHC_01510 [Colletotrichum higginsianum]
MRGISAEALIAVEWLFITIALCLIIARINLRIFHLKAGFVLSDAFIAAAFAAGVSLNAVDITLYLRGVYEPDIDFKMTNWVATEAESVYVYRTLYFLYFPFYFEQYFNKGTLLALYYEIFGRGSTKIRASLLCLVAYCAAGFITTMCMILFYCKSYTATCPQRCWVVNDNLGWALHFSSDVFIFILPLVYISKLNMSKAQKISASVTFSIGLVNILITLSRWFIVQAVFTEVPALNTGPKSNATSEGLTTGKEETLSTSRVTSSSHDSNKKAEEVSRV